jgi:hypothetical protein
MKIRAALSGFGLLALVMAAGVLLSPDLRSPRQLLESEAEVLVRLQEAHLLDFYGYTANPNRMAFEPQKHVRVQIELAADRLGWSAVLTDERRPGRGCAVFGGTFGDLRPAQEATGSGPLSSPGGATPTRAGVPVCDTGL